MHDNKPYVLALESKSKTKEGNIGSSILSLKRSFRRDKGTKESKFFIWF